MNINATGHNDHNIKEKYLFMLQAMLKLPWPLHLTEKKIRETEIPQACLLSCYQHKSSASQQQMQAPNDTSLLLNLEETSDAFSPCFFSLLKQLAEYGSIEPR